MYCKKCGAFNNDDNEFCGKCGEELKPGDNSLKPQPDVINIDSVVQDQGSPAQLKKHNIIAISIAAAIIIIGVIAAGAIWMNTGSRLAHKQLSLGEKYLSELKYDEAVAAFNKTIEIDPKNAEAYIGLADANIKLKNIDKAKESLKKGIAAIPKAENLYIKLADIYISSEDAEEAVKILESGYTAAKSEGIKTKLENSFIKQADVFLEKSYVEEAVKILEEAYAAIKSNIIKAKLDKIKADINTRGNSAGNIINGGYAAKQGTCSP